MGRGFPSLKRGCRPVLLENVFHFSVRWDRARSFVRSYPSVPLAERFAHMTREYREYVYAKDIRGGLFVERASDTHGWLGEPLKELVYALCRR